MPLKIVSLVPSITELLVDLGWADALVGRTGFCIHPAGVVQHIPKIGGTKAVNLDKIRALAPTHVVVNVDENEKPTVDALRAFVPHVVVTHPQSPADNIALIDQLMDVFAPAHAINTIAAHAHFQRANHLKHQINAGLSALQAARAQRVPQRVLYLIWQGPWMTVARDTYISRMLDLIGWQTWPDVQGGDGIHSPGTTRYPALRGDEPWLADVQRVLLSTEPYSFGPQHLAEVKAWMQSVGSHARVQLVDGEMLSWYGSRAVKGLDYLEALVSGDTESSL
jgi:ABC-type Fe3+-hydroxamate transport system substrate-binding protein